MPHDSVLFGPVFRGEAVIRIDDVRRDPRSIFATQQSLPPDHPTVASYLAVPVVSRTGEVLGGLLLGDVRPGHFTERHEHAAIGLAAQAATALDNARLYRAARQEIAERQHAEDALRESQERLRAALTASETGTFRWDLRTGIVQADGEAARLLDRPRTASGRPLGEALEFVHPDDRHAVTLATEHCAGAGTDLDLEFRINRGDGTVRWIAVKGKVYRDPAGNPLYLTGAVFRHHRPEARRAGASGRASGGSGSSSSTPPTRSSCTTPGAGCSMSTGRLRQPGLPGRRAPRSASRAWRSRCPSSGSRPA